MSILSFTDKKISLILVTWILFSSLFSLPIKGITGNRILGSSMYFIFEILLLTFLLIRNSITKNIRISNFDIPFLLYLFYGIFQLMWSYLNNNGLYQIIYDYRRFYFSVLFYLVIRQYLTYYPSIIPKVKKVLFFVIILTVAELYFEFIYGIIFQLDINKIPWISLMQNIREEVGAAPWTLAFRMISIFPYPHNASLISAAGCLLFLLEYKISRKYVFKWLSIICFFGILLGGGRTFYISIFLAFIYLSFFDPKIKKTFLIIVFLTSVCLIFFINTFLDLLVINKFIEGIIAFFFAYDLDYGINFFIISEGPTLQKLIYFLFGSGLGEIVELSKRYAYIGIYGMEWRVFQLLFQYGAVFIIILGNIFLNVFKQKNQDIHIIYYKVIILQFLMSLPHYMEIYTFGVFQVFLTIYALFTLHIYHISNGSNSNKYKQLAY